MKNALYVTQPSLPDLQEFLPYLERIWDSKILTNGGQFHQELESALCEYTGVKYCSLFCNGTIALQTALQALDLQGEIITTPFTFVATAHAIMWNNCTPVFCDIDPETYNIDVNKIEELITDKTVAILPVHVYGEPCDLKGLEKLTKQHGLRLIYDAAHAFGVKENGQAILHAGDISMVSFHATKVFSAIEGGALFTNDEDFKRRIDSLKNFGFDEGRVQDVGTNGKLNEVQSAFGLLSLTSIDVNIAKRKSLIALYRKSLSTLKGLSLSKENEAIEYNYSYFPVLIDEEVFGMSRDEVHQVLEAKQIFARKYFSPLVSDMEPYKKLVSTKNDLSIAENISEQILCLPLFAEMSIESLEKVVICLKECAK